MCPAKRDFGAVGAEGAERMQFGLNFFPTVRPEQLAPNEYYTQALALCEQADALGYSHVKTVEHYFRPYGGYSPSPIVFLSAVAQRTARLRVVTGAVLPAFNHPIKLAAELAMLDNLSGGRLEAGFARAFLPEEFDAFGVSLDESRLRYEEGIAAIRRLWTEDEVVFDGAIHRFGPLTLQPRPLQRPHPPVWGTAVTTPESFAWIGAQGMNLMFVPYLADREAICRNLEAYRTAYAGSGACAPARVQMSYHLYVAPDDAQARAEAEPCMAQYIELFKESAAAWLGRSSGQYKGYERLYHDLDALTYRRVLDEGRAFIGSPERVAQQIAELRDLFGEIEPSFQIMFGAMPFAAAQRTLRLFAEQVMPAFAGERQSALVSE